MKRFLPTNIDQPIASLATNVNITVPATKSLGSQCGSAVSGSAAATNGGEDPIRLLLPKALSEP